MRFALFLFNLSVFKDRYSKQVYRTTVRPWCHLFLRQQTWQEHLNSAAVVVCGCGNRASDFQAWVFSPSADLDGIYSDVLNLECRRGMGLDLF